jgi:hypothetical protein
MLEAVTKNVTGASQAFADTSEGKTAVSQVKVQEAMEKIGGVIDKIAVVALPILASAFTTIADVVANVFPYVAGTVKAVLPVFQVVFGTISGLVGAAIGLFRGMAAIIGAVWNGVTSSIKGAINFVIDIINGAIRGINKIQVHIHVGPVGYDFNGLKLGYIPRLHSGGIVPGMPGSEVLTILQAGERVTPAGSSGGGTVIVNINIPHDSYIDGPAVDRLANLIATRLRHAPGT